MGSVPQTCADIVWAEAEILARQAAAVTPGPEVPGARIDLATAAVWAVRGEECRPRDLTETEATWVAEVLDTLEDRLGMTVPAYEASRADRGALDAAWDLGLIAWGLERELAEAIRG